MAGTISSSHRLRCSEESDRRKPFYFPCGNTSSSTVKHKPAIYGLGVLSWVDKVPTESRIDLSKNIDLPSPVPRPLLRNPEIAQFVGLLRSCARRKDLPEGIRLHDAILQKGLLDQCCDALVSMYAKCGALAKAKELFDMQNCMDVYCWTSLIVGYVRRGQSEDALHLFDQMQHKGLLPDAVVFACILKACATLKLFKKGKKIHGEIARQGLLRNDIVLGTALIDMYAKCGALSNARCVLEELSFRDVVCWNSLITGYVQHGQAEQALECFCQLEREGIDPDAMTFACILKACGTLGAKEKGEKIHEKVVEQDLLANDIALGNALVYMYAKCGALQKAQQVLEKIPSHDVVSWSALISGFTERGQAEQALECFQQMQHEGLSPDAMIFVSILKACGTVGAIDMGEKIHDEIARKGLLKNNIALGTALVDMYAKCGALSKAKHVFDNLSAQNVTSWNSLITAYIRHGQSEKALDCYEEMQREGISPDSITFTCILRACAAKGALEKGVQIHDKIVRQGLLRNNVVLCTSLVDMYAKCGALAKAQRVHDELPSRDIISWNALIGGYMEQGHAKEALGSFKRMQEEGFSTDVVTLTLVLKACGILQALDKGAQIHDQVIRQGLMGSDIVLDTAVVDMYAQCGDLMKAAQVHKGLPYRDVVAWNSLISGYSQEGQGEQALHSFEQMRDEGICPDATTFTTILKVCGNVGAIDKGKEIHYEIEKLGFLQKNTVLGTALVDMYVNGGDLVKAQQALKDLPSQSTAAWNALIAGYTKQGQGGEALLSFEQMQKEGISPDGVTLSCVLAACSHLGLVDEGHEYFMSMQHKYGVKPNVEHYSCIVDLFGRAGHLEKAVKVVEEMPPFDDSGVWHALLGACGRWGNVTVGRWAFEQAANVEKSDVPAYVLMANMYAAAGMQEDAELIEAMSLKNRASKSHR